MRVMQQAIEEGGDGGVLDRETAEFERDPGKWGFESVTSANGYTLYKVR